MSRQEIVALAQKTLLANRDHLHALESYTRELEAELERFDKLLEAVDAVDEPDLDLGGFATIPGSVRATAPISTKEFLSPESPFHEDALRRSRYQNVSEAPPMKPKELEVLAEAVQAESYRMHALDIQQGKGSLALSNTDSQAAHVFGVNDDSINWDRVAEKVSNVYTVPRTARGCEIRWCGEQHPGFNREAWSQEEIQRVKSLAADFADGRPDWVTIAEGLGTHRTPLDCMQHATSRKLHQWTTETDERLLKAIDMYGHENWHLVARYVSEDATPSQCSSRFQKTLDKSIKHSSWTPEEDARLSAAVAAYGSSWIDVAANVPGRHNDQCRDRWVDHLDPSINKSRWSEEEDRALTDYVREHMDASWKQASEHLRNGRTEAMCRHRYTVLQRSAHSTAAVGSENQCTSVSPEVRSSNSASRWSKALCFKAYPPALHATPAPPETEHSPLNQLVFLEPVVNSNPESHKYEMPHLSQYRTRFKTTATNDTQPLDSTAVPPSKKRRK